MMDLSKKNAILSNRNTLKPNLFWRGVSIRLQETVGFNMAKLKTLIP